MKTKHSPTPTNFIRWKTQNQASYRIYRVLREGMQQKEVVYVGSMYKGELIPFLGKTQVVTKELGPYIDYCSFTGA
jgi:hypothetical protein